MSTTQTPVAHAAGIIALSAATMLAACGGGGDDVPPAAAATGASAPASAPGASDTPTSAATTCPSDYKAVTLDNAAISNATYNLVVADATFSFSTSEKTIKVCLGRPAKAITQTGFTTLSDTYEVLVVPVHNETVSMQSLQKQKLSVKFALKNVPAGTSGADKATKIKVYSPDAGGTWKAVAQQAIQIDSQAAADQATSVVDVTPAASGKFVVAFKP